MISDALLYRVGVTHAALVTSLLFLLRALVWPLKGALLGAGLIGFSFVTFWVVARSITDPRRKPLAILLGTVKVIGHLGLSAAVLSGRLIADGIGFALGVSCFIVATLLVALASRVRPSTSGGELVES